MSMQAGSRKPVRFRGRSYLAYMLTPEPPVYEWLTDLDSWHAFEAENPMTFVNMYQFWVQKDAG